MEGVKGIKKKRRSRRSGQSDEWRLRFFVRVAIELLTSGPQATDEGFQLFASKFKKQFLSLREYELGDQLRRT
jgi:hypothetical protein